MYAPEKTSADDLAFLDGALDRAIALIEEGRRVAIDELAGDRPDLSSQLEDVIRTAHEIAVAPPALVPTLRGYTVLRELGHGGMGTVYLARQERLGGRLVALKVLPAGFALSERSRDRFVREAETIACLRHPNIVAIYDVVRTDGVLAYAMEWIDGTTLAEAIDVTADLRVGPPNEPLVREPLVRDSHLAPTPAGIPSRDLDAVFTCRLGIAIARALAEVHRAGLLHRDVKPSNILIRRDGTPVLTDFGLAREIDSAHVTQPGHFAGTPAYAPPEQLRGESENLDSRGDIYALGVTIYHALALRLPFDDPNPKRQRAGIPPADNPKSKIQIPKLNSPVAMLRRIEAGLATPLRRANPRIPRDLETIVAKAMDADPARRYQTADDLADDLERLLSLQPIKAKRAGPITRTIKLMRRNQAGVAGAGVGSVAALLLAIFAGMYLFWLPKRVELETRAAHLQLLDPTMGELIFIYTHALDPARRGTASIELRAKNSGRLERSLEHYATALAIPSFAPRGNAWFERLAVGAALAIRSGRDDQTNPRGSTQAIAELRSRTPLTGRVAESWISDAKPPEVSDAELRGVSIADRRTLGLLAFLCGDARLCIRAWDDERLDMAEPSDPLVDAMLGQVYQVAGELDRAYPRLDRAVRAFDDVAYLRVLRAEAAIAAGDFGVARKDLDSVDRDIAAGRTKSVEPFESHTRVRADLHAALYMSNGDPEDLRRAEELYAIHMRRRAGGRAQQNYARLLEFTGRPRDAMRTLAAGIDRYPTIRVFREDYVAITNRWWESLDARQRYVVIRASLNESPYAPDSLVQLLRMYVESVERLSDPEDTPSQPAHPTHGTSERKPLARALGSDTTGPSGPAVRSFPPSLRRLVAPSLFSEDSTALPAASFASSLERLTLLELANRMEVTDMQLADSLTRLTAIGKEMVAIARSTLRSRLVTRSLVDLNHRSRRFRQVIAATLLGSASLIPTSGQVADFMGLGDLPGGTEGRPEFYSRAYRVSADGTTVVGYSESSNGTEAFRWRIETEMQGLGDLPGNGFYSEARDVSADGTFVCGYSTSTYANHPNHNEAFRWDPNNGMQGLGDLPGSSGWRASAAHSISDDGSVICGGSAADWWDPFRWTIGSGMQRIHPADGLVVGTAAVNAAGNIVAYSMGPLNGSYSAHRWTEGSGTQYVGQFQSGFHTLVADVTDDGQTFVGNAGILSQTSRRAFRWTAAGGFTELVDLPGGDQTAAARRIAADGSRVVGLGTSATGSEAVMWDEDGTVVRVADLVSSRGGNIPVGWILTDCYGIAINGNVITLCGTGVNPNGDTEAWVAHCSIACPGDLNGDGDVDLSDLAALLAAFGTCAGDPGFLVAADFDASGCIDLSDLSLLLANFGTTCP